jgi:hypothetical protein
MIADQKRRSRTRPGTALRLGIPALLFFPLLGFGYIHPFPESQARCPLKWLGKPRDLMPTGRRNLEQDAHLRELADRHRRFLAKFATVLKGS